MFKALYEKKMDHLLSLIDPAVFAQTLNRKSEKKK